MSRHHIRTRFNPNRIGRRKMRKGRPSRIPIVICPHCNKEGGKNGMMRWHFDKCKLKLI